MYTTSSDKPMKPLTLDDLSLMADMLKRKLMLGFTRLVMNQRTLDLFLNKPFNYFPNTIIQISEFMIDDCAIGYMNDGTTKLIKIEW